MPKRVLIHRLVDVPDTSAVLPAIENVFFASSNTQTFADAAARAAFRERWLGRYLTHDLEWAYVALSENGALGGYLIASLDDPALMPRFADIPYFAAFKDLTRRFPAHLHVNLAPGDRGAGIGSSMIERFAADAAKAGSPGVHVVTSVGARNVTFYERNGFSEQGTTGEGPRAVVLLGRRL